MTFYKEIVYVEILLYITALVSPLRIIRIPGRVTPITLPHTPEKLQSEVEQVLVLRLGASRHPTG